MLRNRLATLEDVEAVNEIFTAHSKYLGFVMKVVLEEAAERGRLLVCEDTEKNEIVGAVNFGVTKKGYITIYEIASKYERRGIGKKMLEYFFNTKMDIKLKVTEDNLGAIEFYTRNGFKRIAIEEGKRRKLYVMYYKSPRQKRLF